MTTSPSSSGLLLPLPGSPASSWAVYRARIGALLLGPNTPIFVSFWFFGLINNVLYVIILSAAQDLVGSLPKGVVLLADVLPSFASKLIAPYFIHRVPYSTRVPFLVVLSAVGMFLIATTPPDAAVSVKLFGVMLASLSSGIGELSFLGLTHYYGPLSLAAWGSGTGAAGLAGAGLYVVLTSWLSLTVRVSLLTSAVLPVIMLISFFAILPHEPLRHGLALKATAASGAKHYAGTPRRNSDDSENDEDSDGDGDVINGRSPVSASSRLLGPGPGPGTSTATAYATLEDGRSGSRSTALRRDHNHRHLDSFATNVRRTRALFVPYMLPLLLVYVAEYTINQGVAPTLLFPLDRSPFDEYRGFYPFYGFLYQLGVFVSRSSTPFLRIHNLYLPSLLQLANLALLTVQAIYFDSFLPSVYLVFLIVFWEGLLGGAVYVNTFAEIMENVPEPDREFSLGATSVSDSAGICIAGFVGMAMEVGLCDWQIRHGRPWCREMRPSRAE